MKSITNAQYLTRPISPSFKFSTCIAVMFATEPMSSIHFYQTETLPSSQVMR